MWQGKETIGKKKRKDTIKDGNISTVQDHMVIMWTSPRSSTAVERSVSIDRIPYEGIGIINSHTQCQPKEANQFSSEIKGQQRFHFFPPSFLVLGFHVKKLVTIAPKDEYSFPLCVYTCASIYGAEIISCLN